MNKLTMRYGLLLMSEAFTVMAEALREEETKPARKTPKTFVCPICEKECTGKGNYVQHSRIHLENRENVSIWK